MKKTLTILIISLCLSFIVTAQTISFLRRAGNEFATGNRLSTDAAGNVYATGLFNGTITFGATTLISDGGADIFLVKYNSSGVVQWAKRAGGTPGDGVTGLAVTSNSLYFTGTFSGAINFNTPSSSGSNVLQSVGSSDIYLAKYDLNGNLQWLRQAGGNDDDASQTLAADESSVYISGNFVNTADFSTPGSQSPIKITSLAGSDDIFVAKYDNTGNIQWVRRAGGKYYDIGKTIVISNSSVYVAGEFMEKASFTNHSGPSMDISVKVGGQGVFGNIFLAKFDADGNIQWVRRAGSTNGSSLDQPTGLAVSGSSVFMAGYSGPGNFNTPSSTNGNQFGGGGFIAKYNDAGDFQWFRNVSAFTHDLKLSGSSIYITGRFWGTTNFNTPPATGSNEIVSAGDADMFLAKFNDAGTFLWATRGGGVLFDNSIGLAVHGTSIYTTGNFKGTANFNNPSASGSNELVAVGTNDFFLAKYNDVEVPAITNKSQILSPEFFEQSSKVFVFPSPAISYFNLLISGNNDKNYLLKVYDASGRMVETKTGIKAGSAIRFGEKYNSGIYFAEVYTDGERKTLKVIKQ